MSEVEKIMEMARDVSNASEVEEAFAAEYFMRKAVEALVAERGQLIEANKRLEELWTEAISKAQVQQEPVNYTKLREAAQRVIENAGIKGDQMEVDMDVFRALEDAALEAIK